MIRLILFSLLITFSAFSYADEFRLKLTLQEMEAIKTRSMEKYNSDLSNRIIEDLAIYDLRTIASLKCRNHHIAAYCIKKVDRAQPDEITIRYELQCTTDIRLKMDPKNKCYPTDNFLIRQSDTTYPYFIDLLSADRVLRLDF